MFTGIIQALGVVTAICRDQADIRLEVDVSKLPVEKINPGDSVAVNGACLTTVSLAHGIARFDVSAETLNKCLIKNWVQGQPVNLELALTLETPIGGHLVSGHVDGIATLRKIDQQKNFSAMKFEVCREIGRYIAAKGSVALDGISLTSNTVSDQLDSSFFEVMLVPHTLKHTTLGRLKEHDRVHVEVDQVARYIDRMQQITLLEDE